MIKLAELDLTLPATPAEVDPHDRHIRHSVEILTKCGCLEGGGWIAACRAGIVSHGDLVRASRVTLEGIFGDHAAGKLAEIAA